MVDLGGLPVGSGIGAEPGGLIGCENNTVALRA